MTDFGPGPTNPQPATPAQPPVPPAHVPPVNPATPGVPAAPAGRSRAWVGWTIAGFVVLAVIVGSCAWSMTLFPTGGAFDVSMGDTVGVIRVDGVIAGTGASFDGYVTPEDFNNTLSMAEDDDAVKAIVIRVDSPGGTVAASEEIAAYVEQCSKPVVVSVGDVGASGAYMLASQADEIWAMPGSAVGSIGVITEIPNVEGLLDKVGVEFQVITAGKYKDAGSPYRPMTDEEKALIQGEVDDAYDQFVDIVASGRKMPRSEVESLATGWAWNGERAKELGLVDEIGTFEDALDAAAKRGGIKGDYEIQTYEDEFGDVFGSLLGVRGDLADIAAVLRGGQPGVRQSLPR